jgi:hypothetical protein
MRGLFLTLLVLSVFSVGCSTSVPQLRNPQPEVLAVPPPEDDRYSRPVEYPKELLNRPPVKPTTPGGKPGVRTGGGPSMGPGGGMGY